ncbi:MAG: hypothetical protein IJ780_03700 [Neisseriaceae bacterium]|nr:hypothetical protein [Neisseriaceae bacterium]MBR1819217.1 hypothetical protein [Neisseriaceae bacterium]
MRIYLSYAKFKSIRNSIIISDLLLIIATAITFYASFFIELRHFFIFAFVCFLVKLFSNLFISFVEKQFCFPSTIHLMAPLPIFTILIVMSFLLITWGGGFLSLIPLLMICLIIAVLFLIKYIIFRLFHYKIQYDKIIPAYRLYKYYTLMGGIMGKNMNMVCLILQLACFYSISFSILFAINADDFVENRHPIQEFVFSGLFSSLACFAIFNFIEIMIFLLVRFPKSGRFFEYEEETEENHLDFMSPAVFAGCLAFIIASSPYIIYPFVKNYLGSQYEPTMERLIEQKQNNRYR